MFNDVGNKIKSAAKLWFFVICSVSVVGMVSLLVVGVQMLEYNELAGAMYIILGLSSAIVGLLIAYIVALLIAGFGEIVCCQFDRADYAEQELEYKKQLAQSLEGIRRLLEEKKDKNEF